MALTANPYRTLPKLAGILWWTGCKCRNFLIFICQNQGFRYMSCVYWPLLTAVFSCLQIVPPMNKMKGAKNEISGKSRKMLQFYWKCMFMIFLAVKSWFHGYFLIKLNINKTLERSFIEIYGGTVDWVRSFVIVFAWCATKKRYEGKQQKVAQNGLSFVVFARK